MRKFKLTFVVICLLAIQTTCAESQLEPRKPLQFGSHKITLNDVRVTLIESANINSSQNIQTTSLLFMVEHLGEKEIKKSSSSINFLDLNGETIPRKGSEDEELVKSGTAFHSYSKYKSPWQTKLPKAENQKQTYIVHEWFRTPPPSNAKFLAVTYSGVKFKFPLNGG